MPRIEVTAWRRERRAFGQILCTPPEGDDVAAIVIRERVRPLVSLRVLVERHGGSAGAAEMATISTIEGELAAVASFEADAAYHAIAAIYTHDACTIIEGRTARADQRERLQHATRELAVHFPIGLGQRRYRRFWYRPPSGWQGLARGLVTDWFPLDHPRNPASMKVLPARPLDPMFHVDTWLRDDLFAGVAIDDVTREPLALSMFRGTLAVATAGERVFLTAVLEDRQYAYVLRLATSSQHAVEHRAVFDDVVRSCVPLPLPASTTNAAVAALDYWA